MVPEKARAELFKYDPAGNLAEADEGAPLRVYGPGNRLLRKGDTEYRRRRCNGNRVRGNNINGVDPNSDSESTYRGAATKYLNRSGVSSAAALPARSTHTR
jgi:hypothetical protein